MQSASIEQRAIQKITWRLIPFLFVLYVIAWMDRVNVSFAALQMNEDLGFSPAVYGLGAGLFFVGYALCEIPSNLILARVGARRWIARIMVTWGILAVAMMFVSSPASFYTIRFLLGVAEAGFFPGIIFYLTNWYPVAVRARAISLFMVAIPISTVVSGPIAGVLLEMHGLMGLAGWQWLFLLEGLPAVIFGLIVWFLLPDKPTEARWLQPDESAAITRVIAAEQATAHENHGVGLRQALMHRTVWQLALIMFACQCGSYGLTLWIPQIVKDLSGLSNFAVAMVSSIPYVGAAIGMVYIGTRSDRTGERLLHIAVPCFIGAVGFAASAVLHSPVPGMIALTIAAIGDYGSRGPFWSLPGRFLTSSASAGGIALINTMGAVGGFVGPYAVGLVKESTGSFSGGLFLLAGLLLAAAFGTLAMRASPTLGGMRSPAAAR